MKAAVVCGILKVVGQDTIRRTSDEQTAHRSDLEGTERQSEEAKTGRHTAETLANEHGLRVFLIPNLYDLPPSGEAMDILRAITGDIICVSWIYPRPRALGARPQRDPRPLRRNVAGPV